MATFELSVTRAKPNDFDGGFSVVFDLTGLPDPFPSRIIEARTVQDALAAWDAYTTEAAASGLALASSCSLCRGSRAPNGWRDAVAKLPYYRRVNV